MKYNAGFIEREGKWAVTSKAGKEYFPNTLTEDKLQAEIDARIFSMRWHRDQIDKLFAEGVTKKHFLPDEHWGDYVA